MRGLKIVALWLVVLAVLATGSGPVVARALDPRPWPHYQIAVDLDYARAQVSARETVQYTNQTSTTLDRLVFNVTPAYFGAFTLRGASVGGQPAKTSRDGVVLDVLLPERLTPGASAEVQLDFSLDVPRQGGRFGVDNGIIALGNWFPILSVYREGRIQRAGEPPGWDRHQYMHAGDAFFTEVGDYDVELTSSAPVVVAHTGEQVGRDGNRWTLRARRVRDFAMAISSRFQTSSANVGGATIRTFYGPEHAAHGAEILRAASEAVAWLGQRVTPYPYPNLMIAVMGGESSSQVGQEYPGAIFIGDTTFADSGYISSYLSYLTVHEVAHQWFYSLVGDDQVYEPWLDEAVVTWLSLNFYRENYPDRFADLWSRRITASLQATVRAIGDRPVDTGIYDYSNENYYFGIVYRKGATFLEEVYQQIGREAMWRALRQYAATLRHRIARTPDLFDQLQRQSDVNLGPIVARYFTGGRARNAAPFRLDVGVESGAPGQVTLNVGAPVALAGVRAYLDDRAVGERNGAGPLTVGSLPPGDYLLTVVAADGSGREAEWTWRADPASGAALPTATQVSSTPVPPTATITATSLPPTRTPTAVPTATGTSTPTSTATGTAVPTNTLTPVPSATTAPPTASPTAAPTTPSPTATVVPTVVGPAVEGTGGGFPVAMVGVGGVGALLAAYGVWRVARR